MITVLRLYPQQDPQVQAWAFSSLLAKGNRSASPPPLAAEHLCQGLFPTLLQIFLTCTQWKTGGKAMSMCTLALCLSLPGFQVILLACPPPLRICSHFSCFLPTCLCGGSVLLPCIVQGETARVTHFPSTDLLLFRTGFTWLLDNLGSCDVLKKSSKFVDHLASSHC